MDDGNVTMERTSSLISIRPVGFVDGASYSGVGDTEFRFDVLIRIANVK